jgi:hypothetical protein
MRACCVEEDAPDRGLADPSRTFDDKSARVHILEEPPPGLELAISPEKRSIHPKSRAY